MGLPYAFLCVDAHGQIRTYSSSPRISPHLSDSSRCNHGSFQNRSMLCRKLPQAMPQARKLDHRENHVFVFRWVVRFLSQSNWGGRTSSFICPSQFGEAFVHLMTFTLCIDIHGLRCYVVKHVALHRQNTVPVFLLSRLQSLFCVCTNDGLHRSNRGRQLKMSL